MVDVAGRWDESYRSYLGRSHGGVKTMYETRSKACHEKSAEVSVSRTKCENTLVLFK